VRKDSRHAARKIAVQTLYWLQSQPWDNLTEITQSLGEEEKVPEGTRARALELSRMAEEQRPKYEQMASTASDNWEIDRIGRVERVIIRLALAEWDMRDVPPKAVMSEAVNLAREFCGDRAAGFVNGVLDRIAREHGILNPTPAE
jgi:N utilization substance protein B